MNHSPDQLQAFLDDLSPADVLGLAIAVGHDPEKPVRLAVSPEGLIAVHQEDAGTTMKLASFHQLAAWPKGMPCAGYRPDEAELSEEVREAVGRIVQRYSKASGDLPDYPEDMRGPD